MGDAVLLSNATQANICKLDGSKVSVELSPVAKNYIMLDTIAQTNASQPIRIVPAGSGTGGFYFDQFGAVQRLLFGGPSYTPQHPVIDPANPWGGWHGKFDVCNSTLLIDSSMSTFLWPRIILDQHCGAKRPQGCGRGMQLSEHCGRSALRYGYV